MTKEELRLWAEFHNNPRRSNLRNTHAQMVLRWIDKGTVADLRYAETYMDANNWFRPPGVPRRSETHGERGNA